MNAPHPNEFFLLPEGVAKVSVTEDSKIPDAGLVRIRLEDHTVGNLVKMQLLRDPDVLFAGYRMPHPLEHRVEIKIRTTPRSAPEKAYRQAVGSLITEVHMLGDLLEKQLRSYSIYRSGM